jgi:hypothetical protein
MRSVRRVVPATLSIVLLIFCSRAATAQTFVSGTLSTNTTWTLAQSPIVVTSTVQVPGGVTLTIEPGVVVRFEQFTRLTIRAATGSAAPCWST